jgi:hypothetical protein
MIVIERMEFEGVLSRSARAACSVRAILDERTAVANIAAFDVEAQAW